MVTYIWVNIGSGIGLLPKGTEPLPEQMLTYHQPSHEGFFLQEISQPSITENRLENDI